MNNIGDKVTRSIVYVARVSEGEEREDGSDMTSPETMASNFPEATKDIKPEIQEAVKTPSKKNKKKPMHSHIIILLKNQEQRENLKISQRKEKKRNKNGSWRSWPVF